jgi:hypothetical protein
MCWHDGPSAQLAQLAQSHIHIKAGASSFPNPSRQPPSLPHGGADPAPMPPRPAAARLSASPPSALPPLPTPPPPPRLQSVATTSASVRLPFSPTSHHHHRRIQPPHLSRQLPPPSPVNTSGSGPSSSTAPPCRAWSHGDGATRSMAGHLCRHRRRRRPLLLFGANDLLFLPSSVAGLLFLTSAASRRALGRHDTNGPSCLPSCLGPARHEIWAPCSCCAPSVAHSVGTARHEVVSCPSCSCRVMLVPPRARAVLGWAGQMAIYIPSWSHPR